jgi:hypothetical protein
LLLALSNRFAYAFSQVDRIGTVAAGDRIEDEVASCLKVQREKYCSSHLLRHSILLNLMTHMRFELKLEKKAEKSKKAVGMEARLIKDPDAKSQWETNIQEVKPHNKLSTMNENQAHSHLFVHDVTCQLDDRLAAAKRALATKKEQAELFGGAGQGGMGASNTPGHVGPTNDQYLDKAEEVHDKIDASLVRFNTSLCLEIVHKWVLLERKT